MHASFWLGIVQCLIHAGIWHEMKSVSYLLDKRSQELKADFWSRFLARVSWTYCHHTEIKSTLLTNATVKPQRGYSYSITTTGQLSLAIPPWARTTSTGELKFLQSPLDSKTASYYDY